jgi:hypothetical protein
VLINFLIRVALIAADGKDPASHTLSEQCIGLLDAGLAVWQDANIKLAHFEKQISSAQDQLSALLTGISVLRIILLKQPSFFLHSLGALQTLLRPAFETHINDPRMVAGCVGAAAPVAELKAALLEAGFRSVDIDVDEASRAVIATWFPGSGAERYVASASITAKKAGACGCGPSGCG